MNRLASLARFLWDFVIGDDWRIAVAVVVALGLVAVIGHAGWILLPVVAVVMLGLSVAEVARAQRRR